MKRSTSSKLKSCVSGGYLDAISRDADDILEESDIGGGSGSTYSRPIPPHFLSLRHEKCSMTRRATVVIHIPSGLRKGMYTVNVIDEETS